MYWGFSGCADHVGSKDSCRIQYLFGKNFTWTCRLSLYDPQCSVMILGVSSNKMLKIFLLMRTIKLWAIINHKQKISNIYITPHLTATTKSQRSSFHSSAVSLSPSYCHLLKLPSNTTALCIPSVFHLKEVKAKTNQHTGKGTKGIWNLSLGAVRNKHR